MTSRRCCCTPSNCSSEYGPFNAEIPASVLFDMVGIVDGDCAKCSWMNSSWEVPWYQTSPYSPICTVLYRLNVPSNDSDKDTCCWTEGFDEYRVTVAFTINETTKKRDISAIVQAFCVFDYPEAVTCKLIEDSVEQFDQVTGTMWVLPYFSTTTQTHCDVSGAEVTIEIP